jgi:hypothetical protein
VIEVSAADLQKSNRLVEGLQMIIASCERVGMSDELQVALCDMFAKGIITFRQREGGCLVYSPPPIGRLRGRTH